mgnify:CR=1 FL=1
MKKNKECYDIIVIGGGHAGVEAALASARLNNKTLLLVGNINKIASMPCNPSIGGPAKGIIVREIDALGGEMGIATDKTLLQLKMLNSSKGPAVRALRAQADKTTYPKYMQDQIHYGIVISTYSYHPVYTANDVLLINCNRAPIPGETGIFSYEGNLYIRIFHKQKIHSKNDN